MNLSEYLVVRMGRATRDSVALQVLNNEELFSELLYFVRSGSKIQRMKGSWVLSGIHKLDSSILKSSYPILLECLYSEVVGGVKRELLRCFEDTALNEEIAGRLITIAMSWVTDQSQDLAVRYLCYRLLKQLLKKHTELQRELNSSIELYRSQKGSFP